jgi:peptide deformylase
MHDLLTIADRKNEKFLRKKTTAVDFSRFSRSELRTIIQRMRAAMKQAEGIGLAANQIGLPYRIFIARIGEKSYTVINPEFISQSKDEESAEEGCLSVPGKWGSVSRAHEVTLIGQDMNGKKLKIKAWGLLARVFQHEVDHLNGRLFIDRARETHDVPTFEGREDIQKK